MNKNSEKMSLLEREKLKKRLQTLFEKQERKSSGKSDGSGNKKFQSEQHTVHNFQATKREMNMNEKKTSKPQQSPTVITNKKKNGPQTKESHNDKTPAANSSSKFNLKNKKSPQASPVSKDSKPQEKKQTKGKKSTQTGLSQQNGTVKSKNNSKANKNVDKSKNLKKEEKTSSRKSTPQAQKHQKLVAPKKQNKAETCNSNKSVTNGANSLMTKTNRKNKRNKKRKAASESSSERAINTNKKPKLNNGISKNNKKNQQPNYDSSSEQENVYDMKNMKGLVRGGDYDDDSEEYKASEDEYWLNQYNNEQDSDDSDSSSDAFNQQELIEHELSYSDDEDEEEEEEEEEYYNSDSDEDHRAYWDFEDEEEEGEEEEEHHYSDYDEDDYEVDEEEEDSYDYSMDSDSSSDYFGNDSSYDFNYDDHDDDDDYNLPENVPEDLIIHRGTATKRDIKPEDNVNFDSDHEEAQIVELQEQETVKVIQQPKAYDKEELMKLKYCEKTIKTLTFRKQSTEETSTPSKVTDHHANDTNDCPKLVPIVDEDGFQLYNPNDEAEEEEVEGEDEQETSDSDAYEDYGEMDDDVSLGSEYMEIDSDDADSLLSGDINDKYLNRGDNYSDSADEIDENIWLRKHKVDIIDATKCKYLDKKHKNTSEESKEILNDDIKQLPSVKLYKNVDLKTASSITSITIIDNAEEEEKKQTLQSPKAMQESLNRTKFSESLMEETVESENTNESASEKISRIETQQIEHVKSSNYQSLVNYNTKFFNALNSNLVIVLLKDPFYIYGTVRLTLLLGNVEIYGHTLSVNKEVEVFSPRGCNVIGITPQTKSKTSSKVDVKDTLKNYEKYFALVDLKTICDEYDCERDAVVLLKRNETPKKVVQQFKKFMNENVFPNLNNIRVDRPLYNSEYLLRCMINTSNQELKCLRIPQQWQQLSISATSRVMIAGGKGVGKSTLLRYLINRSLPCQQQILLIDLDIGQPEVFIPQTVSCTIVRQPLLGPGFMLNLEPDISYAVGHTNIALCAHKYLEAVRRLIAYCMKEEKYQDIPWLINTMGYNKGFGLELISVIVKEFTNLTDIIQLQSAKEINNFDVVLHPHVLKSVPRNMFVTEEYSGSDNLAETKEYHLHVWQSAVQKESRYQKEWEMSAKDLRFAILLTRLSQALQGHAEWLTDCKPLCAPLDKLKIVNLMDNTPLATTEELAKSLEANLVYLCHYQEENNPLKCLGIGVVRAIDFHVRQVYLLPAMPYALLKSVNCLALGEMCLPTSIFTNQGPRIKNTAPFVYNTIEANASKAIKQIYHRPRRFLTGKHKKLN